LRGFGDITGGEKGDGRRIVEGKEEGRHGEMRGRE